jgi:small subunit ribosomal protein YMR-31
MYFDRDELPARFRRAPLSMAEIEAVETGGATLFA